MDRYLTLEKYGCDEFVVNKSRFIGYAKPVTTAEEAVEFVNEIKSRHADATHNVYAYAVRSPEYSRYSDDGEPQGTAGIPTLDVIKKSSLTDCCIVVTRYFGGILLGAGGLVRAYSHGAKIAVDAAKIICMSECSVLEVMCDYSFYSRLMILIPTVGGIIENTDFGEFITVTFRLPAENEPRFSEELTQLSFGRVFYKKIGQKYDAIDL